LLSRHAPWLAARLGITGIGMLSAAVIGGAISWIGPMTYLVLSEYAIQNAWRTPWIWPDRPPHDAGADLCATLAFVAGLIRSRQRATQISTACQSDPNPWLGLRPMMRRAQGVPIASARAMTRRCQWT